MADDRVWRFEFVNVSPQKTESGITDTISSGVKDKDKDSSFNTAKLCCW